MSGLELGGYMVDLEEKAITESDDAWHFKGYAAVFNNRDKVGDIIVPGAFKASLQKRMPRLHVYHKMLRPDGTLEKQVGLITEAGEDGKGLRIEGELLKVNQDAKEVVALLKPRGRNGIRGIKGLSIGYKTNRARRGTFEGKSTRWIEEADCFEVSFVEDPANTKADVDYIKSVADNGLTVDEFKSLSDREREAHLRSLGLSDSWSKYFVKCTREAGLSHKAQREAGAVSADMPAFGDFLSALKATANR